MNQSFLSNSKNFSVYSNSVSEVGGNTVLMARIDNKDYILASHNLGFKGEPIIFEGKQMIKSELNHENACILRKLFRFTAPVPVLKNARTFGVGDRLGIATTGHIRVFERYTDVFPVFAQQSMRELKLTGRSYEDVLDSVTFAVFKNGFKRGFGADGDHLKTPEEIEYALSCGYSMITLDCSQHIRNEISTMSDSQVNEAYTCHKELESVYLGKTFDIGQGEKLYFDENQFKRTVLIYEKAIDYIAEIYNAFFAAGKYNADFEVSIDETETPTTPIQHFFVANELKRRGVVFATLAPRFCGSFEKGIDYIGNLDQFERELAIHSSIAMHFGYKLSIHSGSDKFSVFPAIGRLTKGAFHVKTAGTNWLVAMNVIAQKAPSLYREIHKYALKVFNEAKQYYHVSADLSQIPDVDNISDEELPALFEHNDSRQLIHITYGLILNEKDSQGNYIFKDRLYKVWDENSETYASMLEKHIGKHLDLLYSEMA